MDDKLYQAAKFYQEKLEDKHFLLIAIKKKQILLLEIFFDSSRFKHLLGLHKLTDIIFLNRSSDVVYQQILNKTTTIADISGSKYFSEAEKRIDNFEKIGEVLLSPDTMKKSLYGSFGYGRGIEADYLLSQKSDDKFVHLFLRNKNDIVLPVTFFTEKTDFYLRNNTAHWNIVDVEELAERDDAKRKAELVELRDKLDKLMSKSFEDMRKLVRETVTIRTDDCVENKSDLND